MESNQAQAASVTSGLEEDGDDTRHQRRDWLLSHSHASHVTWWRVVRPFLAGGCITMVILMIPVSLTFDGTSTNGKTNFWVYVLFMEGIWNLCAAINYEMIFHAAFSQLGQGGATLVVPRWQIWAIGYLAYLMWWIGSLYTGMQPYTTTVTATIMPALTVLIFYVAAAVSLIQKGDDDAADDGVWVSHRTPIHPLSHQLFDTYCSFLLLVISSAHNSVHRHKRRHVRARGFFQVFRRE